VFPWAEGCQSFGLVLKRFRQGLISSGKAANILGWSRRDFLDLLAAEGIPLYDPSTTMAFLDHS
jgi:predicted HTH domain antitoxin